MGKKVELYVLQDKRDPDEWIEAALKTLGLEGIRKNYLHVLEKHYKNKGTFTDFLKDLCNAEADWRNENLRFRRFKKARFPLTKTLENFDFDFPDNIDIAQIHEIASLRFIQKRINVIIMGAQGTGKTHLAISFGVKAIEAGKDVVFVRLDQLNDLVNKTSDAQAQHRLFRSLVIPQLLIIDDWDVYKVSEKTSIFMSKLIQERYQNGSIIITSTGSFSDWKVVFGNDRIAAKMIDRLTHDSEIVTIEGESYRNRNRLGDKQAPSTIKSQATL